MPRVVLDLNSISGYETFLKIKSLPVYAFQGREAWFPAEYAERIGLSGIDAPGRDYAPHPRLFDYQRDIAAMAIRKKRFAVFADCGLGKTLIAVEFIRHCTETMPRNRAILIVSPLMVIDQTLSEIRRFYGDAMPIEPVRAANLPAWLECGGRIGITNYEAITDRINDAGRLGALVLDESSLLKSHYGKWGQRLIQLGRGLRYKLCLTGTPAPNDRIEYANHAVFLDQYPTVNAFLARFFVNRGETANRWELKPHALRAFYTALSHWCIFLSDPAVYGWRDNTDPLPPINSHIIRVPVTAAQARAASDLTGDLLCRPGGISQRQKLARIAKGELGNRPAFVANLVNSDPRPCIVWCKYNSEQDELARLIPGAANVSGDTPAEQRITRIRDFQAGRAKTIITKPKIMGFGLNLQIAERMIFSTLQDSYEEYYQAVKRANRYGSKNPLDVYIPVTDLERPMVETVLAKARRIHADTREQERLFRGIGHERSG